MRRNSHGRALRPMNDSAIFISRFNRKFNTRRKCLERWHEILSRLNSFDDAITHYDGASPDEIRDMKTIHRKLYECKSVAEKNLKEAMNLAEILR